MSPDGLAEGLNKHLSREMEISLRSRLVWLRLIGRLSRTPSRSEGHTAAAWLLGIMARKRPKNWFHVLGVSPNDSPESIRRAYLNIVRQRRSAFMLSTSDYNSVKEVQEINHAKTVLVRRVVLCCVMFVGLLPCAAWHVALRSWVPR